MARAFNGTTARYILLGIDTVGPFTDGMAAVSIAVRFYQNNSPTDTERMVGICGGGGFLIHGLSINSSNNVGVNGREALPGTFKSYFSTGTLNNTAWNTLGGVLDYANDDLYVYLNGTLESSLNVGWGVSNYTHSTSTRDDDTFGVFDGDGFIHPADGNLAEVALWTTALGQADFDTYNLGYSPLFIKRESLLGYWHLFGRSSPESERINGLAGTVTGATWAAHPRVIYPSKQRIVTPETSSPIGQKFILPPYRPIIS
jgi:hypothetical protein